jgi:SAM-dependent methyltransferase
VGSSGVAPWLLAVAVAVSACDRGDGAPPGPPPTPGHRAADDQAEFDRERRPDLLVATAALRPGEVVADIGAGTGLLTGHLARAVSPGGRVLATDVDGAVLELLRARVDAAGLGAVVTTRLVRPDEPGLEPATYDVVLLSQVDHFLDDPVAWLRAALPGLTPGGRVVLINGVHHRAGGMAAAAAAGLSVLRESTEIPGQYVAVFVPRGPAATPPTMPRAHGADAVPSSPEPQPPPAAPPATAPAPAPSTASP